MTGPATGSTRASLNIRIVGEGITLRDLPINDLARMLSAAAALLRSVAEALKVAASDAALVGLEQGSVALRFEAATNDDVAEECFDTLAEAVHKAVRTRGDGVPDAVRAALGRLYESCQLGPLEVGASTRTAQLGPVLMAQPKRPMTTRVSTTAVLHGRVEGVLFVKSGFEVLFKPEDGGARRQLAAGRALADQAAKLFAREARAQVRFERQSDGTCVDWELQSIRRWEPRNLLDVMAKIGDELYEQGFSIDSDRFEESLREQRRND